MMMKAKSQIIAITNNTRIYLENPKEGKNIEKRREISLCGDDNYNVALPLFTLRVTCSFLR